MVFRLSQLSNMENKIKVSVLIQSYNFENYIESAIISALFQTTNFNYEIIILDDKSNDTTFKKIKKLSTFDDKIKVFQNEKNMGVNYTFKKLIELATGEYIAFLDGDDFWIDNFKLQKQVDFLDNNKDYVMCFTGHIKQFNDSTYEPEEDYAWLGYIEEDEIDTIKLLNNNPISSCTKMFRNFKNIIKPYFDEITFLDWALNFEISKMGKIKYLDTLTAIYRYHKNGLMSSMTVENLRQEYNKTLEILKENIK